MFNKLNNFIHELLSQNSSNNFSFLVKDGKRGENHLLIISRLFWEKSFSSINEGINSPDKRKN